MIKSSTWIRHMVKHHNLVTPFADRGSGGKSTSMIPFGLTDCGYTVRCEPVFRIFDPAQFASIDPKGEGIGCFTEFEGDECLIPANSFAVAYTMEHFCVPNDVLAVCSTISEYLKCGVIVESSLLEPGWDNTVELTIINTTPLPVRVYSGEGIAHLVFHSVSRGL
jgi:dCTP deaminase